MQKAARQRRLERTAEVLYVHSKPRHNPVMAPLWEDLSEITKDKYRMMAELAVEAYEPRS